MSTSDFPFAYFVFILGLVCLLMGFSIYYIYNALNGNYDGQTGFESQSDNVLAFERKSFERTKQKEDQVDSKNAAGF